MMLFLPQTRGVMMTITQVLGDRSRLRRLGIRWLVLSLLCMLQQQVLWSQEFQPPMDREFVALRDGSTQRYVELLPTNRDFTQPLDLVIALHGHGSDRWQYIREQRGECRGVRSVAARHGMLFVAPDYRAKTSWMGPAAEADLLQLLALLRERYRIRHIYLVGGSMGGTSALIFASLHPQLLHGVVAQNATANMWEYEHFQDAIAVSYGGDKITAESEYKKRSPELTPQNLSMPIACTVGGLDAVVPPDSVRRLMQALMAQGRQDLLLLDTPQGGHETNFEQTVEALEFVIGQVAKAEPIPQSPVQSVAIPAIQAAAIAPDRSAAVIGSAAGLQLRTWPALKSLGRLDSGLTHVHGLAFSPNGSLLAAVGGEPAENGRLEIWSWPSRELLFRKDIGDDALMSLAWNNDGRTLAMASMDAGVYLVSAKSGQVLSQLSGHARGVLAVDWLQESNSWLTGGIDESVRVWRQARAASDTGPNDVERSQTETSALYELKRTLSNHTRCVNAIACRPPQGTQPAMAASASDDGTIRLWQPEIGRMVRFQRFKAIPQSLVWRRDGETLLATFRDGTLRQLDPDTLEITGHWQAVVGPATCVAHDGEDQVLVGGEDSQLAVIQLK